MNASPKPLGRPNYGSIPHLPGSRLGPSDKQAQAGHVRILTEQARPGDRIIVTEKLDGSNVGVFRTGSLLLPLTRAGYLASTSPYLQHHMFADWVAENFMRFWSVLEDGERLVGEWLAQAHGTRYALKHEPFVAFDLMRIDNNIARSRLPFDDLRTRCKDVDFITPTVLSDGGPIMVWDALEQLGEYGHHGAIDYAEGAVWRCEGREGVDILAKYVRSDKQDGKYLPDITGADEHWNWSPASERA